MVKNMSLLIWSEHFSLIYHLFSPILLFKSMHEFQKEEHCIFKKKKTENEDIEDEIS